MIELESITKSFDLAGGRVQILKGISIYISKGEFVSIMGPSGSGKSTLSSILGCLSQPTSGTYKINGEDVTKISPKRLAKIRNVKIGFIFQDFNLLDGLPAWENVALPLFYSGIGNRERKQRALECLKSMGLEKKVNHYSNQLSGGQKQRVAIARALVNNPDFLFADEPTGALDASTSDEIMGLLQCLNLQGNTIVQVTHSPVGANYSKRILSLVDGMIIKDEVVDRPILKGYLAQNSPVEEVVGRAWRVLGLGSVENTKNYKAVKDLYQKGSKSGNELVEAVKAVVRWNNREAEAMLSELFKNENWMVRAEVVRSCNVKEEKIARSYFFSALSDGNAWVRHLAISAIRKMNPESLSKEEKRKIVDKIDDDDERVRASSVTKSVEWKDYKLIDKYIKALDDVDGRVRANTIEALAKFIDRKKYQKKIVSSLKKHFEDKNNRARANVAVVLYPYSPRECVEVLTKMIVSDNNLMRASSSWAFGTIPSEAGREFLIGVLKAEKDEMALNQAIRSLTKIVDKTASYQKLIKDILV